LLSEVISRGKKSPSLNSPTDKELLFAEAGIQSDIVDTIPARRKLPANVSNISIKNDIATVKLKNGDVETYNLENEEELAIFEKKYGKMPAPPSPPAPTPAKPGGVPPPPPPPPVTRDHVRVEQKENSKGYIVTVADNNGECVVIIKDKDKKIVKAMPLTEWNDNESANEAKYGEIPAALPAKEAIPAIPVPANPPAKARVSGVEVVPVPAKPSVPARPSVPAPGFDEGIIVAPSQEKFYIKPPKPVPPSVKPSVQFRNINSNGKEPLIIIDGVKQPFGEQVLNKIDPNDIESIQILKDGSAKANYGEQAAAGVIIIKTKNASGNKPLGLDQLENFGD
jgi:TonB-dependent SusC/RagA subfamily outer membrane receptor